MIAVRNGVVTLQRCLDSVFEQRFRGWELLVIDGASSDGTVNVIQENAQRIQYWETRPDRGIYHAWNKALAHVRADWVLFLGADDRLRDADVLDRAAQALARAGEAHRVAYASVEVTDSDGTVRATVGRPWTEARTDFLDHMAISHQATFHRRSLFADRGTFDERYRICGDYEFLLRELLDRDPLFIPGLVLTSMGAGGLSDRPDTAQQMILEFYRARRAHGLERWPEWLSPMVLRMRIRCWLTRVVGAQATERVARVYRALAGRSKP